MNLADTLESVLSAQPLPVFPLMRELARQGHQFSRDAVRRCLEEDPRFESFRRPEVSFALYWRVKQEGTP